MGTAEIRKALDDRSELNLAALRAPLEAAGWDAFSNERELMARFDYPPTNGVWTLMLDRSGRFRFIATRDSEQPEHSATILDGRVYTILSERLEIITVTGRLKDRADLEEVLKDLFRLAAN